MLVPKLMHLRSEKECLSDKEMQICASAKLTEDSIEFSLDACDISCR